MYLAAPEPPEVLGVGVATGTAGAGSDRVRARVIKSRLGLGPDNPVRWNDVMVLLEKFDGLPGLGTEYAIRSAQSVAGLYSRRYSLPRAWGSFPGSPAAKMPY